jgi:hypothetical protein
LKKEGERKGCFLEFRSSKGFRGIPENEIDNKKVTCKEQQNETKLVTSRSNGFGGFIIQQPGFGSVS